MKLQELPKDTEVYFSETDWPHTFLWIDGMYAKWRINGEFWIGLSPNDEVNEIAWKYYLVIE